MLVNTITSTNCTPQTIVIGRRGTYDTIQIAFDLSYLIESYGSGTAVLAVKRSQDTSAYPAVVIQEDNTLTWTVSETDTYYVGSGECQLMWYVDGGLAKTIIYPMVVMRDILSTAEEPPDGYENWIEHLTGLGAETQQNAQNAAHSASEAEQAKDDAVNAKEASEEAARKAAAASVHAPIIQNGFWYIWNDDQYVNTNVRAEGEKGDKGDTGEKGDTGNGIASITKTGTSGLVDTYTVTYTDGTSTTFTVTNGAKGDKGDTGATGNGIASIAKTGTSGNVDTYTITYTNGQTVTFTVTNGAVSSVAGKTGAVVLDSGDIEYDSTETYTSGTVGAELDALSRQISDVEENQIPELKNAISDIYKTGDNLADPADFTTGQAITRSGSLTPVSFCFATGLIPIGNAKKIYVRGGLKQSSYLGHYFYRVDLSGLQFASCSTFANTRVIDVPQGARYFRATGLIETESSFAVGIIDYNDKTQVGVTETTYIQDNSLADNTVVLDYTDILPGEKIYYSISAVNNSYAYLTVYLQDGTFVHYGKTGSAMTGNFYDGSIIIPDEFAFLRWRSSNTVNKLMYLSTVRKTAEENVVFKKETSNINRFVLRDDGYLQAEIAYGFSARNIYIPNGFTVKISTNELYHFNVHKYNEYGEHIGIEIFNSLATITADANIWISINVFAYDTATTFDDDFEAKSSLAVVSNYEQPIKEKSGALLNRTIIEPDVTNRYCRIPCVEVMPNKKVLCLYDSRQNLSDASDQYIAYEIINSQNAVEKSGILEQKASNVYRQNECMSFTMSNGDIGVLFTNILVSDEGEAELRFIKSQDYGNTWGASVVIDATETGSQLFVAPSTKPVSMGNDVFLIPIWKRNASDRAGTSYQSGIMLFNASTLAHSEKYVTLGDETNECNVWLNSDKTEAILCCRRELSSRRYFYKIDVGLTGNFVALEHYLDVSSWIRPVCQEGTYKLNDILIVSRQTNTGARNSLKLFCSDSLGRKSVNVFDTIEGIRTEGYSCVTASDNIIYILSEGADKIIPTGKCLFLDRVYINDII